MQNSVFYIVLSFISRRGQIAQKGGALLHPAFSALFAQRYEADLRSDALTFVAQGEFQKGFYFGPELRA